MLARPTSSQRRFRVFSLVDCREDVHAIRYVVGRVGIRSWVIVSENGGIEKIVYIPTYNVNEWLGVRAGHP